MITVSPSFDLDGGLGSSGAAKERHVQRAFTATRSAPALPAEQASSICR